MQFHFRYSHNDIEPWKAFDLKKKTKGRPVSFINTPFPQLYPNGRMVNKKKVDDLMVLLVCSIIYHDFYKKLQSGDAASDFKSEDMLNRTLKFNVKQLSSICCFIFCAQCFC